MSDDITIEHNFQNIVELKAPNLQVTFLSKNLTGVEWTKNDANFILTIYIGREMGKHYCIEFPFYEEKQGLQLYDTIKKYMNKFSICN